MCLSRLEPVGEAFVILSDRETWLGSVVVSCTTGAKSHAFAKLGFSGQFRVEGLLFRV